MTTRKVTLEGGSPWGFRMHGGNDVGLPLRISRVNPGSKAAQKGIREGDVISAINGSSTKNLDNSEAHLLLKNAGHQLRLSLNEDGPLSPRRRSKQTVVAPGATEQNASSGGVTTKKLEIRTEGKEAPREGSIKLRIERTTAETQDKETNKPLKMPKKNSSNKKRFKFLGSKITEDAKTENGTLKSALDEQGVKERYSSFYEMPEDARTKSQAKKQKKKDRKNKLDLEKLELNIKMPLEMSDIPITNWESAEDMESCEEKVANCEENVVNISEVKLRGEVDPLPSINAEEERSLREFFQTLEMVDKRVREQNELVKKLTIPKPSTDYEVIEFSSGIKMVDPAAEVSEDTNDATFQRKRSSLQRGEPLEEPYPKVIVHPLPKVFYSYNGMPFTNHDKKHAILVQDIDDGILVIDNIRCKDRLRYPYRHLDVIMEENSDVSDTSSIKSEKNKDSDLVYKTVKDRRERIFDGRGKTFDLQIQPVLKETVKVIPIQQNLADGIKTDSTQVRIETVVLEKVHPTSIVKLELSDTEDNNGKTWAADEKGHKVVYAEEDSDKKKPALTANDFLSKSLGMKFIDEESERSWSSVNNTEDGGEADVESELDSRRETFLFDGQEKDKAIPLDDILETNESLDYKTIKKLPFMHKKKNGTNINQLEGTKSGQTEVQTSPNLSGRNSASSGLSGGTVKDLSKISSDEDGFQKDESETSLKETDNTHDYANVGYFSSETSVDEYFVESSYRNIETCAQTQEIEKGVNVKQLAKNLEGDIGKILLSKKKVMDFFEEPVMSEASWSSILGTANLKTTDEDREDVTSRGSNFSLVRFKHSSNSSSYENVSKSLDSLLENENIYEVIQTPEALSNLAEKKVMSLPHGHVLLRKIGLGKCCEEVREDDDDTYTKIEQKVRDGPARSQHLTRSRSDSSFDVKQRCLPCPSKSKKLSERPLHPSYIEFSCGSQESETWYGMPAGHPAILLGLSPSQKKVYEAKNKRFLPEDEAANLLDLHKKFLERRSYREKNPFERNRTVAHDSNEVIYADVIPKAKAAPKKVPALGERAAEVSSDKGRKKLEIGSCGLLAILQNATSDDFVPELNNGTSIGSSSGRTENAPRSPPPWQKEKTFGTESKNSFRANGAIGLEVHRDNTTDAADELESIVMNGSKGFEADEECIITTSLSSVSDAIKTFEEPAQVKKQRDLINNYGNVHVVLDNEKYRISKKGDVAVLQNDYPRKPPKTTTMSEGEIFKQKMYVEYMTKVAERLERRQQKVIRVSNSNEIESREDGKCSQIEEEFISRVKERQDKLGLKEEEDGSEALEMRCDEFERLFDSEELANRKRNSVQMLLDPTSDLAGLPKHLQEFLFVDKDDADDDDDCHLKSPGHIQRKGGLMKEIDDELVLSKGFLFQKGSAMFSPTFKATAPRPGIWSPAKSSTEDKTEEKEENVERRKLEDEPIPPVWTPKSAQASPILERKEFRPVNFESPTLPRKKYIQEERSESVPPPWQQSGGDRLVELVKTPSSPALSLPKAPNPTVTLLQKAREGHLPRGALYLNHNMNESLADDGAMLATHEKIYSVKDESNGVRTVQIAPKKITGIGPTTKEGIPLVLRSEVTDENKEKWYKRMYDSLHKAGKDDDFVTVKYRTSPSRKGLYGYQPVSSCGYQSEPESIIYDTNRYNKCTTLDRRRAEKSKDTDCISITLPRSRASTPRYETYKNQPGRIEDYEPGHSSISELEARQWWNEVLEIFDRQEEKGQSIHKAQNLKNYMTYALRDSAFISDPQHVFKRREDDFQRQLSPQEQKEAYRVIQKGGEVPLRGLRKPAPERPKDNANAQIEYFPLSPTLTRIRVHKQNITPLSQFPFLQFPVAPHQNSVSYPCIPFGVCNSFSQVQIFPSVPSASVNPILQEKNISETGRSTWSDQPNTLAKKGQKFSVQLQNISEPKKFVQIVPTPRSQPKKSPIYANLPISTVSIKEEGSSQSEVSSTGEQASSQAKLDPEIALVENKIPERSEESVKSEQTTFSDLKRSAPSIVVKTFAADKEKNAEKVKKTSANEKILAKIPIRRTVKGSASEKSRIPVKKPLKKVPLSESLRREKPLSGKHTKTGKKASVTEKTLTQTVEDSCTPLIKSSEKNKMNPMQSSGKPKYKHKVESNVTEAFRSRSFSPDVRRKMVKPAETVVPPTPPKRKQSKNSSSLRMWSKMMVTYPHHRSRLDMFDSNVKFLRDKLRRKLDAEDKENEGQFGDDIETFRTVRKDKDGSMRIKTDRYVSIPRPVSASLTSPLRYTYNEHGRRVLSEPRTPADTVRQRKFSYLPCPSDAKKTTTKPKSDTLVKSSTTYSVRGPLTQEDKRKSVKVTVAVSSKGKEFLRKSASLTSPPKKLITRSSPSPCPSISSYKSELSGKSLSEKDSTTSSMSPRQRFFSPTSSVSRISSPSRSTSPVSATAPVKQKAVAPVTLTFNGDKPRRMPTRKMVTKTPVSQMSKAPTPKTEIKRKVKKSEKTETDRKTRKNGITKVAPKRKEVLKEEKNEVAKHTNLVRTDSFFQNLFLRNSLDKKPFDRWEKPASVLERARKYQRFIELPEEQRTEPSLSLVTYYLSQKRPVTLSRFRSLDREYGSRSPSLYWTRSPTFQMNLQHFDSLSHFGDDDYISSTLDPTVKERSFSEPPMNRSHTNSPEERLPIKPASRLSVSETSSLRTSPTPSMSPSCRRIQTYKPSVSTDFRRRVPRARSAGEVEDAKPKPSVSGSLAQSTSSLNLSNLSDHGEYQAYVLELMHSKEKCQRFRDLYRFYSSLERMGELERTTSVTDLRPRLRNEEIIDFDRWKQLRAKERADAELKTLVENLMKVQKEKDLIFRTTDVDTVRWKGDRGLRIKERSVEDLKEQFNKTAEEAAEVTMEVDTFKRCLQSGKDVYKPFWRGSSIVNLASNLNATTASYRGRPVTVEKLEKIKAAEKRLTKKFGIKSFGSKPWSSLSTDQVDALKTQLSEIYGQELRKKGLEIDDIESYEITVPEDKNIKTPGEKSLYVRCSSAMSKDQKKGDLREGKKSGSISALPSWKYGGEDKRRILELPWKEEVRSRQMTETEKKRLSMTLSKEVLEKLKKPVKTHLLPRETLGAQVVASNSLRPPGEPQQDVYSPRTCYSLETSEDGKSKNDFLLVLTPTEKGSDVKRVVEEWANGTSDNSKPERTTSIAELESASASSETSVKTVIRNPVDVLRRVEFYEELQQSAEEGVTAGSLKKSNEVRINKERPQRIRLMPSRSLENLKEYFGEHQRYVIDRGEDIRVAKKIFEEDKHCFSPGSSESVFSGRSRSVSPDPTKYYRAYLKMVKCGAVRKLRNKFESWEDLLAISSDRWLPLKRFVSDPELTRDLLRRYGTDPTKVTIRGQEVGDVRWLRTKYEKDSGRSRGRFRGVPRSPFIASDRFMPRINVISKTAELQMNRRKSPDGTIHQPLASPEPYRVLGEYPRDHRGYYYTGEVEKLRKKFEMLHAAERLSLLGQMYTSTPDVSELRDIAPYLGCTWVAHRHPEPSKTSSPDLRHRSLEKKIQLKPRPHSSSPVRPASILKTRRDIFADQKFDPSIHRPSYRYQPEVDHRSRKEAADQPHWKQWSKPSVKFKAEPVGYDLELKPRDPSPDSPRKYVESEVTIHYKSPVRSEAKEVLSENELARRQAESMKRIYKEERRRKYLQELQDMNSRRHADNFIPSQKSPIPLNRYDDFPFEPSFHASRSGEHVTEPVLIARGLYDFVGKRPRELAFRRGDVIFMIRQLDKNWCEGELNGTVGLFPLSYVEIIPYSEYNPKFGRARAKYDFVPQTSLELSARKGEMITLIRKIDENWFEGRIGDRTGIIPASYCQVLSLPHMRAPSRTERAASSKPVASPAAHSLIHNGSSVPSKHYYTPFYGGRTSPGRSTVSPAVRETHQAIDALIDEALYHLEEDIDSRRTPSRATQPLNLRVNPRPEPALYQVIFNHVPNNDDELELIQGETVLVLEKCGDGWYIGSKTSGGKLGIFPGTHVRRVAPEFV